MTDPGDVRVVIVGLHRWEEEFRRLLQKRGGMEQLGAETKAALERLERNLRRLEHALSNRMTRPT